MGLCPPNEVPVEPPVGEITIDDAMTLCAGEPSLRVSLCRQDDFEFACAQDDGRLVLVRHTTDEDGVLVISVLEIDGSPSTAVPIVCPSKTIEMAPSQIVCVDGVEYTQVPVVDLASLPPAQLATLWFNAVGTIIADPTPGAVSVTLGACTVDADVIDCETVESVCVGYQDVSNFATATNADVILEFSLVAGSVYHIAVEDGAFTGLFGLVSSAISSFDGLRIFDDTLAPNPGMRLWTGGISNVTSLLGGRRIEFDYDVSAAPATSCAATVLAENTIAEGLFGGSAISVGFVAFLSMNLVETSTTVTRKSLSVNLDPCTIAALATDEVFVPHVNGCIERTIPGGSLICDSTQIAYNFSDTDLVGFTITANDGNGNYTMVQEQVASAHATFLALIQSIALDNTRAFEDIGPGFISFNWHEGNISNVVDLSPTEVQFDIHVEAGVSDTPDALITPCTDPVADSVYQSSAAMSRSIYDPVPLNVQQANGGNAINFVVTHYFSTLVPGGDDTVEHIPAKQVVKLVDGSLVETYHTPGDINTEIPFDNTTDVFKNVCGTTTEVEYTACDDTLVPVTVDSVVGAYVLNNGYKHTERVYDNVTASLGGTITTIVTGTNVAFDLTTVTATNWVGNLYAIEFGNGYTDVGNNPTFDFANEPDGNYEIKIYRVFAFPEGFRWFLVAPIEIIKTGSTITVSTINPFPVVRSVTYTVKELLQDYCGNTPVGVPYNVDGSPATVTGFLSLSYREDETEWLGMSDANNGSTVVQTVLQSGSVSIANGTFATTLGPDGTTWVAPASLRSVTVRARRSNTNNATLTAPNRVQVTTAIGTTVLLANELFSWSVEDLNTLSFVQVETFGNSAAYIDWVQA